MSWGIDQGNYEMHCVIWYHLYNLKIVKNTHGGVILLVKFAKSMTPPRMFFRFFKLHKWYQVALSATYIACFP